MSLRGARDGGPRRDARAGRDRHRPRSHLAGIDTIVDPVLVSELPTVRLVAARARRGGRGAARDDRRDAARHRRRARAVGRARAGHGAARSTPTWSTSLGCARRRGASGWPRASIRPTRRAALRGSRRSRSATGPTSTASALLLAGWLALAAALGAGAALPRGRRRARAAPPAATATRSQIALEPAEQDVTRARRSDRVLRVRLTRCRSTAAPAACVRASAHRGRRAGRGRCSAPRAARAGSSARASGRRCCATPPTARRSSAAREFCAT